GSVCGGSNPPSPAKRRIRLAAQDTALSRRRSLVRIPHALPTTIGRDGLYWPSRLFYAIGTASRTVRQALYPGSPKLKQLADVPLRIAERREHQAVLLIRLLDELRPGLLHAFKVRTNVVRGKSHHVPVRIRRLSTHLTVGAQSQARLTLRAEQRELRGIDRDLQANDVSIERQE